MSRIEDFDLDSIRDEEDKYRIGISTHEDLKGKSVRAQFDSR